jgi:DnaK suppressor protein
MRAAGSPWLAFLKGVKVAKKDNIAPNKKVPKTAKKVAKKASAAPKSRKSAPKKPVRTKSAKAAPKKSAPKKSTKKTPVSTPKTRLSKAELEHFRQLLLQKLHEIVGAVNWIENEALKKSRAEDSGDLSNMPIHMADIGTDTYEQEFSLGLMDSERKLVREILDALKRIDRGTYGICEGTGQPIPAARLEANPWARYCVEYASLIEQGKAAAHPEGRWWNVMSGFGIEEEGDFDEEEDEETDDLHPVEEYDEAEIEEEEEGETDLDDSFFEGFEADEEEDDEEEF